MIPPTVYVGDRATLVLPLQTFSGDSNVELSRGEFPVSQDIDFFRIAVERRPGGSRLVVEFAAYTPGILEIPPFKIADITVNGQKIEISSILDSDRLGPVLSDPAGTLAIPGTSLLVYGTLSVAVLLPLLFLLLLFREHGLIKTWLALWKHLWLISEMRRIEKRLRRSLAKNTAAADILDTLSKEFRIFLGFLTGENCRAMTATEIGRITINGESLPDGDFLGVFFTRFDRLRFSGVAIRRNEVLSLLNDLRTFLKTLDTAQRRKELV